MSRFFTKTTEHTADCPRYQSPGKCATGIGRFQVRLTDNANARAIGRRPKWTVNDLYGNVVKRGDGWETFDTLAECQEWAEKRESA